MVRTGAARHHGAAARRIGLHIHLVVMEIAVEQRDIQMLADRMLGEFDIPGMPLRFSNHPELPSLQAPLLGEHNAEILTGLLGYGAAQVAELEQGGVLVSAAH